MPRQPRLDLPGIAQHVIQRGNDRQPCFFGAVDRVRYLTILREAAIRYACAVHAYVLMTNHAHLLVTPTEAGAVARTMQSLGREYVRYVNTQYRRTGTLWEGRYRSCLVDSDCYLLTCQRYIELNPVRAGMVIDPAQHPWSSYQHHGLGACDPVLTPHPTWLALAKTSEARHSTWRELVRAALTDEELACIRVTTQQQRALGNPRFQAAIAAQVGRCATPRPARHPTAAEALQFKRA